jgi:hypothetical protein
MVSGELDSRKTIQSHSFGNLIIGYSLLLMINIERYQTILKLNEGLEELLKEYIS